MTRLGREGFQAISKYLSDGRVSVRGVANGSIGSKRRAPGPLRCYRTNESRRRNIQRKENSIHPS
uniref:Uncharacterized protein n=1 Tax=Picea glauca TaxID=3330 RepID=A0A117NGJ6_PICGL|nr:hypothetical protein ABT39_MTgene6350 [Picea glauca]